MSKRIKKNQAVAPRVLRQFRTVGIVTNAVPCAIASLGSTYTVSTVVGRSIQIYDASSLRLLFLTQPPTPQDIECITAHFHHVFAVAGNSLFVYRRGHLDAQVEITGKSSKAVKILVFGGFVCVATSSGVNVFKWNSKQSQLQEYTTLQMPSLLGSVVDIVHPATYLNKIVVATESSLVLVNVKTGKNVHVYDEHPAGIALVEAAPTALDVVAVVSPDGGISLFNLLTGKSLFNLSIGEPISSVSFRSDGPALLAVSTPNGDVFFYDLDQQRRVQSLRGSQKGLANVAFLPGQAIAVISGANNVLSEYVFDPPVTAQGGHRARLLRRRGGHSAPPSTFMFDEESHHLISGSLDGSLWMFSLRKDSQSKKLGNQKTEGTTAVIDIDYTPRKDWGTLITAYSGEKQGRMWDAVKGSAGMTLPSVDMSLAKSVAVSQCGNFGMIGTASGKIAGYNLQSGLKRFDASPHKSSVTGVAVAPNNSVVYSCSLDGFLKVTEFKTQKEVSSIDLKRGAITSMRYHPGSRLLGLVTDDMSVVLVDTATMRVVREFIGHGNRITSFDFTPNGRWVITASLDGTIRTWDVPSGACIDGVRLKNPVTKLRVSPNSEFVATSHVKGVGVQIWVLQTHNRTVRSMREEEFPWVDDKTEQMNVNIEGIEVEETEAGVLSMGGTQIGKQLTLSEKPRSKFSTLIHLDAIRERNKPTEGVKKPEKMPFFLGESSGANASDDAESASRLTTMSSAPTSGYSVEFTNLLREGDFSGIISHLQSLGPAATDLEIRSLDTRAPYGEIIAFIDAMTSEINTGTRFELVQAWVKMLMVAHRDIFTDKDIAVTHEEGEPLRVSFNNWLTAQTQVVDSMNENLRYCLGVMSFLR